MPCGTKFLLSHLINFCECINDNPRDRTDPDIIGEATKNLSQEVRQISPETPWKNMAGMLDKLIRQYFGVDIKAVWVTAQVDFPSLGKAIERLLTGLEA